jgi:hypothetical protein
MKSFQKFDTKKFLKTPHLMADRTLCNTQLVGRAGKRTMAYDRVERN